MIPALPLLVAAFVCAAAHDKAPLNVWHDTVLLKEKDLTVRLKVATKANLAEPGWLALEFENNGKKPLTVTNAHYWIRADYHRRDTGEQSSSGSLASGNTYDLFPHAWATTPVAPIVLAPGQSYRTVQQPSDYSAALLGLPPSTGWSVRAHAFIALDLSDGRHLSVAQPGGTPFTFDWLYPDDAGFKTLRARLGQLLRSPENKPHHAYILEAYLGIPQIARAATAAELVTALAPRRQPFEGRSAIVAHLAKHFGNDPAVTECYRRHLKDGDAVVLSDLHHKALWSSDHVKPLVNLYESDPSKYRDSLAILHRYRDDWINDAAIVRRLSAVVQRQHPVARKDARRLKQEELDGWARAVESLSMTGDQSAITLLRRVLEDKRAFRSTELWAMPLDFGVPPLRVCDVALDAILTLLDGSPDAPYRQAGRPPVGRRTLDAAYAELRDRMIAELQERLAARDKRD